eukprot:4566463-Prymnesium_polylepis.1
MRQPGPGKLAVGRAMADTTITVDGLDDGVHVAGRPALRQLVAQRVKCAGLGNVAPKCIAHRKVRGVEAVLVNQKVDSRAE